MCKRFPILPSINEVLRLYNVKALKYLSQNFLLNSKLTDKIVRAAGKIENGEICEIGPGPGCITRSILKQDPSKVFLIEKDERFKPILEDLALSTDVPMHIAYADIRNFDMSKMFSDSLKTDWNSDSPNIHLIGNLPFSVSTYLMVQWLKDISLKQNAWSYGRVKMTLTFQDDLAMRMAANERSRLRNRLGVMCQNWCSTNYKFMIKGSAFLPKPEVNVGVLQFEPLQEPLINLDFELIEKVLNIVFTSKNKYLANSIQNLFPKSVRDMLCKELLEKSQVNPNCRVVYMSMAEWQSLIETYKYICDRDPNLYNYNPQGRKKFREEEWKSESNLKKKKWKPKGNFDEVESVCKI